MTLRYLSVCSGIGAETVAWRALGWQTAAFSEIDEFPRAVLQHRWPDVPLHGDFTTIKGDEYGPIDTVVGGTPCQSFSVAGLRKGFADHRGNLTLAFIRLVEAVKPRWVVWENVPGVLSVERGKAFGAFLGGLAQCGYGFAYRVLDAQYFGVPQRRRRVFVIGHFGDWRPCAAVLFEPEGLRGDITPGRETRKTVAPTLSARPTAGGGMGTDFETGGGLIANCVTTREGQRYDPSLETLIAHTLRGEGFDGSSDGTSGGIPIVFDCKASGRNGFGAGFQAPTLRSMSGSRDNGGGQIAVAFAQNQRDEIRMSPVAGALAARPGAKQQSYVAAFKGGAGAKAGNIGYDENTAPTLSASPSGTNQSPTLATGALVRRLTPRECERLQGLPDDYTLVPLPLKKRQTRVRYMSDSARYKMIGNSMAVPVMAWIGDRISRIDAFLKRVGGVMRFFLKKKAALNVQDLSFNYFKENKWPLNFAYLTARVTK